MLGINNKYAVVAGWYPVDKDGGGASNIISLKNYNQAEIYIMVGSTMTKTAAVTLDQGVSVSSCDTTLGFETYYEQGLKLKYDGASSTTPAAAGETATGAATGVGTVYEDRGNELVLYNWSSTAFVDNEVLTFSGGKTAVVNGTLFDEDAMIPRTATANTFNITQVLDVSKIFMIPVNGAMLTDGNDCIEVNIADPDTCIMACFYVLSEPRYSETPMPTAIYD